MSFSTVKELFQYFLLVRLCRVSNSVEEILKGLRCYFDNALPVMLLYNNERKQYEENISEGVSPSTVYGAEHLLRLFGKAIFFVISMLNVALYVWLSSHETCGNTHHR